VGVFVDDFMGFLVMEIRWLIDLGVFVDDFMGFLVMEIRWLIDLGIEFQ
jgi:hypothetical protein